MTKEEYESEIWLTNHMLEKLNNWDWHDGSRSIRWERDGYLYEIHQQAAGPDYPSGTIAQTMYMRDELLHRLDGPAYFYKLGDSDSLEMYEVNGNSFNVNEFAFFISGVVLGK